MSQAGMENIFKRFPFFILNYQSEKNEKIGDIFTVNNLEGKSISNKAEPVIYIINVTIGLNLSYSAVVFYRFK